MGVMPPLGEVRAVLAERVSLSANLDPYFDLDALASYSSYSAKTLRAFMARAHNPLPHYRLTGTGKIVVRKSDFDNFMAPYRHTRSALDELIETRRRDRAARRNAAGARLADA